MTHSKKTTITRELGIIKVELDRADDYVTVSVKQRFTICHTQGEALIETDEDPEFVIEEMPEYTDKGTPIPPLPPSRPTFNSLQTLRNYVEEHLEKDLVTTVSFKRYVKFSPVTYKKERLNYAALLKDCVAEGFFGVLKTGEVINFTRAGDVCLPNNRIRELQFSESIETVKRDGWEALDETTWLIIKDVVREELDEYISKHSSLVTEIVNKSRNRIEIILNPAKAHEETDDCSSVSALLKRYTNSR